MLKLMYITNNPEVAKIAQDAGVDRIFVDMEYIGKSNRQGGMDTVQSHHTVEDVRNIRKVLDKSQLMVRVNPIHEATSEYTSSKEEIDAVIDAGADIIMLPYFKTVDEVKTFIDLVDGRAKVFPLLETKEAVECIDDILSLDGIDEIHIGLNDLHLSYNLDFLFELLCDGTVENLCDKFKAKGIPYGFGGIGRLFKGDMLPAEKILVEHYRLGSTRVILSRAFCNTSVVTDLDEINSLFNSGMKDFRKYESRVNEIDYNQNLEDIKSIVSKIVERKHGN